MKKSRLIRTYWTLLILGIASFFSLFIMTGTGYFGEMPEFEQLENPNTNLATQIISSDGEILGKYYFNDNRTPITCLLYTSPSPRDRTRSRMPSSA